MLQLLSTHAACPLTGQSGTLWYPVHSAAVAATGAWPGPWKTLRDCLLGGQSFVLEFPGLCLSGITSCTETPVLSPLPPGGRAQLPSIENFCFLHQITSSSPLRPVGGMRRALWAGVCVPGPQETIHYWKSLNQQHLHGCLTLWPVSERWTLQS